MRSKMLIALGLMLGACSTRPPSVLAPAEQRELVAYEPRLPNPAFWGGLGAGYVPPKDVRLKPFSTGKPKPIMVPRGITNLALNRPVTSSDTNPIRGSLAMITDGDKQALPGRIVELAPGSVWVQIDLGEQRQVCLIHLWHDHTAPFVYRDVVVQISNDQGFEQGVVTVFNNDHDNTLGQGAGDDYEYEERNAGLLINCMDREHNGQPARYIRCWSNGRAGDATDLNHYSEVEVWGMARAKPR